MENTKITLNSTDPQTFCEIDAIGCGITNLQLGGRRILWSGARPDGGYGFTHPCIPNFNLAKDLPNHGPARKAPWLQIDEHSWGWTMEEIPGIYPAGISATREFKLDPDLLEVITTIANRSEVALPINIAEHYYFPCQTVDKASVTVDGQLLEAGALAGVAVFKPWPLPGNRHQVMIPNLGKIILETNGYGAFAQWSLVGGAFVCTEPLQVVPPSPENFMNEAPKISPGESKVFSYKISLES